MSVENFLSNKLRHFSSLDIFLVKIVYLLVGVLVATNYIDLLMISWIFYLVLTIIAALPLGFHFFSIKGSYVEKIEHYLKTNKPAYQVLLFFTMFFFGCLLSVLIPALASVPWWIYVILIIILAIKPARSNLFW